MSTYVTIDTGILKYPIWGIKLNNAHTYQDIVCVLPRNANHVLIEYVHNTPPTNADNPNINTIPKHPTTVNELTFKKLLLIPHSP